MSTNTNETALRQAADKVAREHSDDAEALAVALEEEDDDEADLVADDLADAFLAALTPLATDEDKANPEEWAQAAASAVFRALDHVLAGDKDAAQDVADRVAQAAEAL